MLKNQKINFDKLLKYGFNLKSEVYCYITEIIDGKFALLIEIDRSEKIETKLIEKNTGEEYFLHKTDATGAFVGKVRTEYENVLQDIAEHCFEKNIFKSQQSSEIIDYVSRTYGDSLEYLWPKFPMNAIWRRQDNRKWYGILMVVSKRKLNIDNDDLVEVIDLRTNEKQIADLVDGKTIYAGYHMNKKHWITICLDDRLSTENIVKLLNESYQLAKNK